MSQAAVQGTTAPAAPTAPIAGGGPAPATPEAAAAADSQGRSTPTLLVRWRLAVTVTSLLAMALTATSLLFSWSATRSAAADTQQLVRVQAIKVDLLHADALATNAFLVGGLEPDSQRAAYQHSLVAAQHAIADAAAAQPADRKALSVLNADVLQYAQDMELARANNRQGFPVGSAYLTVAGNGLRTGALPIVDNLVQASQQRTTDAMATPRAWLVAIPGIVGLIVLFLANRWMAARFRRRINLGVGVAGGVLLLALVASVALTQAQHAANTRLADGDYKTVVSGATARSAANDAKAQESLRLINRGSGAANEQAFAAAAATITGGSYTPALSDLTTRWGAYARAHGQIVALDQAGSWDRAVALATSTAAGSPGAAFAGFDDYVNGAVGHAATTTVDALRQRLTLFLLLAAIVAVAGIVAAGASWRGVSTRLQEYS